MSQNGAYGRRESVVGSTSSTGDHVNWFLIKQPQLYLMIDAAFCQALSISQSLKLSLSLRDRDSADNKITFHPPTPPQTFKAIRGDLYSSVIHHWNCQLKPY